MTLLEVVLSIVLLGLVGATLAGAMGGLERATSRHKHQLAASEVANALILQHIDDKNSVPSGLEPVAYGDAEYRFAFSEEPTTIVIDPQALRGSTNTDRARRIDRVRLLTVRVWLAEDHGGSYRFDRSVPNAQLTRLYDPLAFANPDSISTILQTEEGLNDFMRTMMDPNSTAGARTGETGSEGNGAEERQP